MSWLVLAILVIVGLLILSGYGKNRIFKHPERYSDAELERIMRLTGRIMDNSVPGSKAFSEAGAKHSAAYKEYLRRRGEDSPFSEAQVISQTIADDSEDNDALRQAQNERKK